MAKQKNNGSTKRRRSEFLGKSAEEWINKALHAERATNFSEYLAAAVEVFTSGDESSIKR